MHKLLFDAPTGELSVEIPDVAHLTPAERIWHSLVIQRLQDLTIRSGVTYCGVYPNVRVPEQPVAFRSESGEITYSGIGLTFPETVSHHVRSCISFARLLYHEFPHLFEPNPALSLDRIIGVLEYHDGDEPFFMDTPDDGSQDKELKNHRELQTFLKNIAYIGNESVKEQLIKDFIHFQFCETRNLYQGWTIHDLKVAQLTRLIDKFDAVLSTLLAERFSHPGHLSHKAQCYDGITEDDQYYIDFCGTDSIADTWAAHFMHGYHGYYGFDIIIQVLYAAVMEVRGEWYSWWERARQTFNLPSNLIS